MTTKTSDTRLLQSLLYPKTVALFGASDDLNKMGARPIQFLKRSGFKGNIYPINPNRDEIQGLKAWRKLGDLPTVPDNVYLMTQTDSIIEAVIECAALGVPMVTILASGFSESGPDGVEREKKLRKIAKATGIRILGPSSLGIVNPATGLVLTANAAFAESDLPPGKVFVASHSGSMIGALVSRGKARGVGFAGLVSVGSEVDLSVGEICQATLDDPNVQGYLLFLESMRHGQALASFARAAASAGKPIIAYKIGRSAMAAEMATTHTGAIAGEDDIADAFFKDMGIARVTILESLLETFPLAKRIPVGGKYKRVGIVTTTGGGAAMLVDQLGLRDVIVEPPSNATLARLEQAGLPCGAGRVLDLTLAGTKYEVMKAALDIMLEAPEFDVVVAVVGSSARFRPDLAVKPIIEQKSHPKPLLAMLVPDAPEAIASLTAAEVPCFRTPECCADAISSVFFRRSATQKADVTISTNTRLAALDEETAYHLLDMIDVARAPTVVTGFDDTPESLPFDWPVVVKVCSDKITHKTELGGVILNVSSHEELCLAMATLSDNLKSNAPEIVCDRVLIQPMLKGLAEALIGYRVDQDVGPIIMLAAGGIWAEIVKDRSIRLAPISLDVAWEMIAEVKTLQTVSGVRGKARGDLEALAQALVSLSQLALRPELGVSEAEVNPLLIMPEGKGVCAVDALVYQSQN